MVILLGLSFSDCLPGGRSFSKGLSAPSVRSEITQHSVCVETPLCDGNTMEILQRQEALSVAKTNLKLSPSFGRKPLELTLLLLYKCLLHFGYSQDFFEKGNLALASPGA